MATVVKKCHRCKCKKYCKLCVKNALIKEAAIKNALIKDAAIKNAAIENAIVEGAVITNATIAKAIIEEAAIKNAAIENALVEDANIANAIITSAAIAKAIIVEAAIENAAIENALVENEAVNNITVANQLTVDGTTTIKGELNLKCGQEIVPVNDVICDLFNPGSWLFAFSIFSQRITSDDQPLIPFGPNVFFNPNSTLPASMYDRDTGIFTAPISGVYSLTFNAKWIAFETFTPSDGTLEGNYTIRWNVPNENSPFGSTIYVAPLANNAPRTEDFQFEQYSVVTCTVPLAAGQEFNPDIYASYTFVPANGGSLIVPDLYVISTFSIYLLTKQEIFDGPAPVSATTPTLDEVALGLGPKF